MQERPPIPKNEDYLFLNYINGWGDSITLAHTYKLTIDQFTEWANSDSVRTRVDALAKATSLRAKAILAEAHLKTLNALLKIALAPPPQTDDPKVLAAAQETSRKAASLLFRAAQKQALEDGPQQPEDPEDPDDDPETDPDGDSNIGLDSALHLNPNKTHREGLDDDDSLPSPEGSSFVAVGKAAAAHGKRPSNIPTLEGSSLEPATTKHNDQPHADPSRVEDPCATSTEGCTLGYKRPAFQAEDCKPDTQNSQSNTQIDNPAPDAQLPSPERAFANSPGRSPGGAAVYDKALEGRSLRTSAHTKTTIAHSGAVGTEKQPPVVAPHALNDRPYRPGKTHSLALGALFCGSNRSPPFERLLAA